MSVFGAKRTLAEWPLLTQSGHSLALAAPSFLNQSQRGVRRIEGGAFHTGAVCEPEHVWHRCVRRQAWNGERNRALRTGPSGARPKLYIASAPANPARGLWAALDRSKKDPAS